jgi:hypothetical protein
MAEASHKYYTVEYRCAITKIDTKSQNQKVFKCSKDLEELD